MTRVGRYQLGYLTALLFLSAVVCYALQRYGWDRRLLVGTALVLLVPGRVQGWLYRDLFRGRVALDRHDPQEALPHLERFLGMIQSHPRRRWAIWLSWSFYTPDIEAMTWNNLGVAYHQLGDLVRAAAAWETSLKLDPLYPIPTLNRAEIAATRGDAATAARLLGMARDLGYSGNRLDQLTHRVQSLLAQVESHGPSI